MIKQIFYSWQSDLPNATNRSFIEDCIKATIKQLKNDTSFLLEVALDKDTQGLTGTPDIANSIFDKISRSDIFIADISIINKTSDDRKTPNPNVLIELGYAVKAIGWEKVICVYNVDYGTYEDLPFDLRVRRPLAYSITQRGKADAKKNVSKILTQTIQQLNREGRLKNEVSDYIKVQFDTQILFLVSAFIKILFGYKDKARLKFEDVSNFLKLDRSIILQPFTDRQFLGFQIFKSLKYYKSQLEELVKQPITISQLSTERLAPIISVIKIIGSFERFNSPRDGSDIFLDTTEKETKLISLKATDVSRHNAHLPNSYLLGIPVQNGFIVQDSGDFIYQDRIDKHLSYFTIQPTYVEQYLDCIFDFIEAVNSWAHSTGGELIIDNQNHFKIQ
ncbi:MAG: hypothetical protein JNJ75_14815 [Cyclobacteriaceae bacterium]|nr:hypothetical protein [Cyclobacteriaceae bacterium]